MNDFLTFLGITNGSGRWYLWWSGIFGDVAIFAAVLIFYRRHNCGVHRCWRFSKHPVIDDKGVTHLVCNHHHPDHGKNRRLHAHHLRSTVEKVLWARGSEPQ